jgi:hypothetical protein
MRMWHALNVLLSVVAPDDPLAAPIEAALWAELLRPAPSSARVFLDRALAVWCTLRPSLLLTHLLPCVFRLIHACD